MTHASQRPAVSGVNQAAGRRDVPVLAINVERLQPHPDPKAKRPPAERDRAPLTRTLRQRNARGALETVGVCPCSLANRDTECDSPGQYGMRRESPARREAHKIGHEVEPVRGHGQCMPTPCAPRKLAHSTCQGIVRGALHIAPLNEDKSRLHLADHFDCNW